MTVIELIVWGILLHLVGDFFFQNEWMAQNKAKLRREPQEASEPYLDTYKDEIVIPRDGYTPKWWDRHPAAWAHAGIHGLLAFIIFPIWAAAIIMVLHLIIDTRSILTKWKEHFKQTIEGPYAIHVAIWQDQTAHFLVIALMALIVGSDATWPL